MLPIYQPPPTTALNKASMGRKPFVRQQILEAAFDLIASEGYEAVSTRMIAAKAEVGPASMFKHFPTKDDLGRELYRVALAPVLTAVAEVEANHPDTRHAVAAFVTLLYRLYDERPRALALIVFPPHEFMPAEVDSENPASPRATLRRLIGGDADLAALVWGAMTGPLQDRYLHSRSGKMSPHAAAHAERIVRLLSSPSQGNAP